MRQLEDVGAVICAAGDGLAPADKKLYALRDVTGTVEAIPLIASSIMSKKIAEGTGALVLDVKVGSGAFMKDVDQAPASWPARWSTWAPTPASTPWRCSPNMQTPLGLTAGNALEVRESVEVLAGGGPADVVELTVALAREMLAAAGRADVDPADGAARRPRHGRLAADDRGPGRRPGRGAAGGARRRHEVRAPARRRADPARRATRSASPPGGSAPAGPARRTRCRRAPASSMHAKPGADGRAAASRC